MTKVLVVGGTGMLGHKLVQGLDAQFDVWTTTRDSFSPIERFGIFRRDKVIERVSVTDIIAVRSALEVVKPDVVINAVGVVKQLPESQDAVLTLATNSIFPQRLAALSDELEFRLITISTDCVFSGAIGNYSEKDIADAQDLYGISKFLGEVKGERCLTLRTSIIGRELSSRHGLVEWFLSNRGKTVKGFVNAIYSGFPTVILTRIISDVISGHPNLHGLYHLSSDPINKFELLKLLNINYKANAVIEPCEEFVIDRSLDSTGFRQATGLVPISWEDMIEQMATDSTPYETWKR